MNENFTNTENLIRYLDAEMDSKEAAALEQQIKTQPELASELENLRFAQSAVARYGLQQKVSAVHAMMMKELKQQDQPKVISIKRVLRFSMRIAAMLLVLLGAVVLFQYYTATPNQLYKNNYESFQLRETRGNAKGSPLEVAYNKGDLNGVMAGFKQLSAPVAEDYFLYGNAALGLQQPGVAIQAFTAIQQQNKNNNTHYFEEAVDYYLGMAYLLNQEPAKALPILEQIHNDEGHAFHQKVGAWFLLQLKRMAEKH